MKIEEDELCDTGALWDAVGALAPGALVTEDEADDYVADQLPPDRLAIVEALLAKTPLFRDRLQRQRRTIRAAAESGRSPKLPALCASGFDTSSELDSLGAAALANPALEKSSVLPVAPACDGASAEGWNPEHFREFSVAGGRAVATISEGRGGRWCRFTVSSGIATLSGACVSFDFGGDRQGTLTLDAVAGGCFGTLDIPSPFADFDFTNGTVTIRPRASTGTPLD